MAYEIITQRFVPSSGGTVSILDSQGIVNQTTIEPIATLGTLTINFPTNVFDGQIVSLFFVKGVTSLTLSAGSGKTFNNTISTVIDGGYISFVYNQALSTYYSNESLLLSTTQLSGTITNTQLAGSITASKLVGTDITTIGTLVAGAVPTTLLSGTITNTQLAGSIAYSKLVLTNSVVSGDIVSLAWSKVTSTPTTLNGYGITDAIAVTTGTLAQFASTTSAQLRSVLSDELGTGVALFDGATPTSFVLTNATSLPIIAGTTGILSVLRGGTGLTTIGGTNTILYTSTTDNITSASTFVFDGTNLGIGLTTPAFGVDLVGTTSDNSAYHATRYSADTQPTGIVGRKARGTSSSPTAVLSGDGIAVLGGRGYGTSFSSTSNGAVTIYAAENFSGTAKGTYVSIETTPLTTTTRTEALKIGNDWVINASRSGAKYQINSVDVISSTTLGSGVTSSSLTSFGNSPTFITPILGTPTSGTLTNCTFPTLNQNTTGSAASLSISGQTGLLTFTGLASTNRIKTIRDAADTILELGGSYTPTGTWTSLPLTSPKVTTGIQDANGNQMFAFTPTASSVDYFTFINAATANPATIKMQATGSDSNVNMLLSPKGTGRFQISDGTDLTKILSFNLSGATTAVTGIWVWSPTTAKTLTFPDVTSTVAALAQIQTFTAAQTFSASFTISAAGASTLAVGTTSSVYRTTNAGSNITAFGTFDIDSGVVAGNKAVIFDTANYITLTHANGTRRMAGASIQLANLNNTAGSEAADLVFLTSTAGAAITEAGRFTGAGAFQQIGKTTKYNNISTVSNGVPSIYATSDLTGQTAAIAATTIYTPTATGLFRISIYQQVTTAATTSSVLGGATGTVITYTDGDGSVAQSITVAMHSTTGTVVTTASGNTTTTNLNGTIVINAKTGVAIQFAIGYTSVGATAMQFSAHLKCEAL